ncbi:MAG: hypothetical protein R2745_12595 [Vicinamibacterales bacterium]
MALTLLQNIGLPDSASSQLTSTVGEPTAAANGQQLFMTGNWFASRSTNGGSSWTLVDPFSSFPATAGGFCCDQIVLHDARHGLWLWLLQYSQSSTGGNIFRLAVSRDASFGSWYYWDFAPRDLNTSWARQWFDYPDMAFTSEQLFVTFNMFSGDDWQRAVVFRFPLATLASAGSLGYRWWATTGNGSIKLTRGAASTMYMGSHNSVSQIRVFQWADSASSISSTTVNIRPWQAGAYSAPGPGGVNWLGRLDQRITGGWVGGGQIGFMWSANRDSSHPMPYIRVVRIRETTKALVDEPDIWSRTNAWAYPAAAPNANGVVGFSAFYGGGARHPSHVVGVRTASGWSATITRAGTHSPPDQSWGDYLSCVTAHPDATQWVASGYTLQGGTSRKDIEPRYVRFRA